jgi:hypothetical protein
MLKQCPESTDAVESREDSLGEWIFVRDEGNGGLNGLSDDSGRGMPLINVNHRGAQTLLEQCPIFAVIFNEA